MKVPEQFESQPIIETHPDEMETLLRLVLAEDALRLADWSVEQLQIARREALGNVQPPNIPRGYVIAQQLGLRCMLAVNEPSTSDYWTVNQFEPPANSYFIGKDFSSGVAGDTDYSVTMLGVPKYDVPRLRLTGIDPRGRQTRNLRYQLLVPESDLKSLITVRLSEIPPEQRFWPFNRRSARPSAR